MEPTAAVRTVKDPVCGMDVVPGIARSWDYLFNGIVYNFCGSACRSRFQDNPKGILFGGPGQPEVFAAPARENTEGWGSRIRTWLASRWS